VAPSSDLGQKWRRELSRFPHSLCRDEDTGIPLNNESLLGSVLIFLIKPVPHQLEACFLVIATPVRRKLSPSMSGQLFQTRDIPLAVTIITSDLYDGPNCHVSGSSGPSSEKAARDIVVDAAEF